MSYNISRWKIRDIHLVLPQDFNFPNWLSTQPDSVGKKWCMESEDRVWCDLAHQEWKLPLSGHELSGVIHDNRLIAVQIECSADGSGHIYSDVLLPLFRGFHGTLNAIVVWESGDSVNNLSIHDGIVEDVELK